MADPRFNKYGLKTNWHNRPPSYDTPPAHGWTRLGEGVGGAIIFSLGQARMRRVIPTDVELGVPPTDEWLVFIGDEVWASFAGTLTQITEAVKTELGLTLPYQGEPVPQNEPSNDYGLLPVA